MHPTEPDTILAATYERERNEFDEGDPAVKFGDKAGHLPDDRRRQDLGSDDRGAAHRRGSAASASTSTKKDPNIVFAIVESEKIGDGPELARRARSRRYMGIQGEDAADGAGLTRDRPPRARPPRPGCKAGDVVTSSTTRRSRAIRT